MGKKKKLTENKITRLGTFNLQGKLGMMGQSIMLFKDMIRRKLDICAFQETLLQEDKEFLDEKKGMIINLAGPAPTNGGRKYGMGFFISNKWKEQLEGVRSINEKISVIKFAINKDKTNTLSIINVYGPTMLRAEEDENEVIKFYGELEQTYLQEKKRATLIMIVGDYNAKIGRKRNEQEKFMGRNGKGFRNENGKKLQEFLEGNDLYLANTHFNHRDHHIATWHHEMEGKTDVHNQIDYIAIQRRNLGIVKDARAYNNQIYRSDHAIVVANIQLNEIYRLSRKKFQKIEKYNLEPLKNDEEMRNTYIRTLSNKIAAKTFIRQYENLEGETK